MSVASYLSCAFRICRFSFIDDIQWKTSFLGIEIEWFILWKSAMHFRYFLFIPNSFFSAHFLHKRNLVKSQLVQRKGKRKRTQDIFQANYDILQIQKITLISLFWWRSVCDEEWNKCFSRQFKWQSFLRVRHEHQTAFPQGIYIKK